MMWSEWHGEVVRRSFLVILPLLLFVRARGGHEQGHPRRVPGRGNGLRSRRVERPLFRHDRPGDLRYALHVRLSGAAVEVGTPRRRVVAADHGQWQDVHDQAEEGHSVRRRSGVRRQEARVGRGGCHLLVEAARRPEVAVAMGVPGRRQVRGSGRGNRGGQANRKIRLRQEAAGPGGGGQVHAEAAAEGHRLQPVLCPRARTDGNRRTRGHREVRRVRRPRDVESGGLGSLQAGAMDSQFEDRARSQSRLPRVRLGLHVEGSRRPEADRADEGQEDAPGRPRRDQHHRGRPGEVARIPEPRARHHEHGGAARAAGAGRRQAQAGTGGEGHPPRSHRRSGNFLCLLEPAGPRRRRAHQGQRSRCDARWRCPTTWRRTSR